MAESDCEIEFLDEDADLVRQCVQVVPVPIAEVKQEILYEDVEDKLQPLLIERPVDDDKTPRSKTNSKRKRKVEEPDSDYDPREDMFPQKSTSKKKKITTPANQPRHIIVNISNTTPQVPKCFIGTPKKSHEQNNISLKVTDIEERNKLDIKIPDYEDPLCLPVKMIKMDEHNKRQWKKWNDLCLERLRDKDVMLVPRAGETKGSRRVIVLRSMKNKATGQQETSVWGKTYVDGENNQKNSLTYQTILPQFREKLSLDFVLSENKQRKHFKHVDEVILTKEEDEDGEMLVAYRPREGVSSVYKQDTVSSTKTDEQTASQDEHPNICLREAANCRVCAPCYQTSWRGTRKVDQKSVRCAICYRSFVSMYNLLAHARTHSDADVRRCKRVISRDLAKAMEYHYKCRICTEKFTGIRVLRSHVRSHKALEPFRCEIGDHMTS